jgi:hypothetical protein
MRGANSSEISDGGGTTHTLPPIIDMTNEALPWLGRDRGCQESCEKECGYSRTSALAAMI